MSANDARLDVQNAQELHALPAFQVSNCQQIQQASLLASKFVRLLAQLVLLESATAANLVIT